MNKFHLSIAASAVYTLNAPTLEALVDGAVVSSVTISAHTGAGADLFDFILDYIGDYPSSLSFRFNDGYGEPRSLSLERVSINGHDVAAADLSAIILTQGQNAALALANTDTLFGRLEPAAGDIEEPQLGTALPDRLHGSNDPNAIAGGDGNDTILGRGGNDIILGEGGNDTLTGDNGDDALFGGGDNDTLIGGMGDDLLNGGAGDDRLMGDDGNDIIYAEDGNDMILADDGDDYVFGDAGNDIIMGGAGNDTIDGGAGSDIIDGGDGDDTIDGGDDNDQIVGGNGNDVIDGGEGADMIDGGNGDDTLSGGNAADTIFGDDGDDTMNGGGGADILFGGAGADNISGGNSADIILGHSLDLLTISSILRANPGTVFSMETGSFYRYVNSAVTYDAAVAAAQGATLDGIAGHLAVITSAAENSFVSGLVSGDIWLDATSTAGPNDEWRWNSGPESGLQFWDGYNTGTETNGLYANWSGDQPQDNGELWGVMYADGVWHDWPDSSTHRYVVEWEGGLFDDDNAADTLNGGSGADLIYGFGGNDVIGGDNGDDLIFGGTGDDTIDGDGGDDVIKGDAGSDMIDGGAGDDLLYASTHPTVMDVTIPVTVIDEGFDSGTGGATYTDGTFGSNGSSNSYVSGSYLGSDGGASDGAARILLGGLNNNTITNMSGTWNIDFTLSADLDNVTLEFSYRALHPSTFENNEDLYVGAAIDATAYGLDGNSYVARYDDPSDPNDSGWITVSLDIGTLGAGNHTLYLGALLERKNSSNEQAELRLDDINLGGDRHDTVLSSADDGSVNTIHGGNDNDTIYGSSGADGLYGDAGNDTLYSGSTATVDDAIQTILDNNADLYYNADTNSFYRFVNSAVTWTTAENAAGGATLAGLAGVQGHLATISSELENDYVDAISGTASIWLGGTDRGTEGQWRWTGGPDDDAQFWQGLNNGSVRNGYYTNWNGGEPNEYGSGEDYLEMQNGGLWNDNGGPTQPNLTNRYVIEWEADSLLSAAAVNTLDGGTGADTLYGNDGMDVFILAHTDAMDRIYNFDAAGRDAIDISDILSFDPGTDDITAFVQLTESGGNTTIAVDANGAAGGTHFTAVGQLMGVTGLDLHGLIAADNLIVS